MNKNRLFEDQLRLIRVHSITSVVESSEVTSLLQNLSARVDREIMDRVGDFTLPEERLKIFTGLTWEQILNLRSMLTSMRDSQIRNVTQALVAFLLKLRSGNSNQMVYSILGIENAQKISQYTESVIKSFREDVLPTRFGLGAINREELIKNHTTLIAKKLHDIKDNQLALICDGTYLRHQKSTNNEYQRKSYSGQKKNHLCKPFTICTTDGYVVDVLGPFNANENDAKILEKSLTENDQLKLILNKDDIFVLDRGFRDVIELLKKEGFQTLMPSLKGKRKQLTTKESNDSRIVTKIRWAVEAVHGNIGQRFKLLHNQFHNLMLPDAVWYCKIACFLHNTFGKRFNSDHDMVQEIVDRMKSGLDENTLADEVESGRYSRCSSKFQLLSSSDLLDFPELTQKDLKLLFTGSYQLKQAVSYLAEMIEKNDNEFNLFFLKAAKNILKVKVRSRHINRQTYNCYVDYQPDTIGVAGIKRHYCECANGRRTIGCCSHVAAVIYYLSNGRYKSSIIRPAEILSDLFTTDSTIPVIQEDSDEDD